MSAQVAAGYFTGLCMAALIEWHGGHVSLGTLVAVALTFAVLFTIRALWRRWRIRIERRPS